MKEPMYRHMHLPPIKAVLFDLDDTLWPIAPVIARAEAILHDWMKVHVPAVAEQYSIEQLRAHRKNLLTQQPHYRINLSALRHAALLEIFLSLKQDPSYVDQAMAVFLEARHAVTLYDDVLPVLPRLREQVMIGVISNGVADLETIGLAHYFQVALAAHSFGTCKPDTSIFHAACAALKITPAEAVYVGDDVECDVIGAKNAGMQAVWLNRHQHPLPVHAHPDGICRDLYELHHWVSLRTNLHQQC